ncbi:MAG: hypothetical protein WED33_04165 [Bacteroidia bacterium]
MIGLLGLNVSAALQSVKGDSLEIPEMTPYSLSYSDFYSGFGYSNITFRDYATSPLFYDARAIAMQIGWPVVREKVRMEFGMDALAGVGSARVPQKSEFTVTNVASIFSGNLHFDYLRRMDFSNFKGKVWLGASIQSRLNFRQNRTLGNNGTGLDGLFNLMASGRLEKDFSRNAGEGKAWLFFKRKSKVSRVLSFQLNIGLLNLNYRPGYAYGGFSEFDGSNTSSLQFLLNDHTWSLNGLRIQSQIEWIINKKKKYSDRWVYSWELLTAPGKYEKFQMVVHNFTYSMLLFKK